LCQALRIAQTRSWADVTAAPLALLGHVAVATGLAVGTLRRAIDILVREHLVRTVPGRGTFMIAAQR
jgi:Bacterial regulatory proteins, gntR family